MPVTIWILYFRLIHWALLTIGNKTYEAGMLSILLIGAANTTRRHAENLFVVIIFSIFHSTHHENVKTTMRMSEDMIILLVYELRWPFPGNTTRLDGSHDVDYFWPITSRVWVDIGKELENYWSISTAKLCKCWTKTYPEPCSELRSLLSSMQLGEYTLEPLNLLQQSTICISTMWIR